MSRMCDLIDHVKDELCGAKDYAYKYVEMKSEAPKWASKFREMAFAEMSHAEFFLQMAKEHAENVAWMSDKEKEAWSKCQSKASEKMAIIKMMLDS